MHPSSRTTGPRLAVSFSLAAGLCLLAQGALAAGTAPTKPAAKAKAPKPASTAPAPVIEVVPKPGVIVTPGGMPAGEGMAPAAAPAMKPTGPQPKLVIDDTTFNAGDVPKGDTINHDFNVKNTGKGDLMILAVKPSCGCTAPDWTKLIPPGGTGKITLKIDTARFKGPVSKTATVTTNDPDPNMASFRLTVNADIKTFIDVLPQDIATFRNYRGEEKREEITIHSNEKGDFKINDVQVTGDGIKHELKKADDGTGDYKLSLWLDKAAPVGNVAGSVKLVTNSTKEPEVTVNVRGTVLGQISVNPSSLYFRIDTASAKTYVPAGENVNIRERGELKAAVVAKLSKDSKLTVVEDAGEWLKVRTEAQTEGWVFKKLVKEQASAAPGADQTKVLSVTHRDENAKFEITGTDVEGAKLEGSVLKITKEPVREGQSYRVTVSYTGKLEKGNYTGTLVIKTNSKDEPEIKVPLYIVVA